MITYYDSQQGRTRYKRRVIWAAWGFTAGVAVGLFFSYLFA
jgi:hypothetical protein